MVDLQLLKDVDDIDHLTLEKAEDAGDNIKHFAIIRIAPEKFSLTKAVRLLKHLATWYPETEKTVKQTDFNDTESVYSALRAVREIILNF